MAGNPWRGRMRRANLGLATLLGLRARGYFVPYRHAEDAGVTDYPAIATLFASYTPSFAAVLDDIDELEKPLLEIALDAPAPSPRWKQDWFPRLDAAAAYAIVRTRRPDVVVEVGSGHSTRFLLKAVTDGELDTRILAIDPAPRAPLDPARIEHEAVTVERAGAAPFAQLRAGDVLVIDSSHVLMPGSDVDILFNRVLPALPAGVIVHVHDVFLPDDYPGSWRWRGYNEQSAVAALLHGGGYVPLFSSHYVVTRLSERIAHGVIARLPLLEGAHESSLWLEKRV